MGKPSAREQVPTTFLDKRKEMVHPSICLIAVVLVLSFGPGVEVKAKRCRKPSGDPGDYAKCSLEGKWQREYTLQQIQETVEENGEKLDELLKTAECGMLVFGDFYRPDVFPTTFIPYHVVTNEEDFWEYLLEENQSNYWLTDNGATGDAANLFMAFQCPRTIKGFLLKNTNNNRLNDRGTQDFTISISDSINGPWTDILTGTLPNAWDVSPVPVLNFPLENEVETKYLRFQVDTYYGLGGGLQYFSTY